MTDRRKNSAVRLNLELARQIRAEARELIENREEPQSVGAIQAQLGVKYGVSARAIQNVLYGTTYREDRVR